jgi:hypothetical protein
LFDILKYRHIISVINYPANPQKRKLPMPKWIVYLEWNWNGKKMPSHVDVEAENEADALELGYAKASRDLKAPFTILRAEERTAESNDVKRNLGVFQGLN